MRGSVPAISPGNNPKKTPPGQPTSGPRARELSLVFAVWLCLSLLLAIFALNNRTSPGLYYDEALFAGFAKDFVTGVRSPHVASPLVVTLLGRLFPVLIQSYLGALKSWLLMPRFAIFEATWPFM
jgi:hypothetical protein